MSDEENPKPIFISECLSLSEGQDFVSLIIENIDVIAWPYKYILGFTDHHASA